MSYADPQSVTVNGTAISLPRTSSGPDSGTFFSSDRLYSMSVKHTYGKRVRRTIRLNWAKDATDPLTPLQVSRPSMSVIMTVDSPVYGLSSAEQKYVVDALVAYLTASSGAKVTQLLGGEN